MKKILLSMMVVGALLATSCKGEKKEEVKTIDDLKTEVKKKVETVKKDIKTEKKEFDIVLKDVKIPNFSNAAVEANLKMYALYAKEYIAAKGDLTELARVAPKGKKLLDKGREMVSKLSKEEQDMYAKAMAKIQSKMAPAK